MLCTESILDQCYTNVQDVYTSVSLPPLGRSDHNLVQLTSKYRSLVQGEPTVSRTIKEWSADAVQNLKGSLDCTDWGCFMLTQQVILINKLCLLYTSPSP